MIDLHSHILPMADDGAGSVEMGLDMLWEACQSGTACIVLTPHYNPLSRTNGVERIRPLFQDFQRIVCSEEIPIRIYLGQEVLFLSRKLFLEKQSEICTIHRTHYLLMEFPFDAAESNLLCGVETVKEVGLIPLIAHPERYTEIQSAPSIARRLVRAGALLQMNKTSLLGVHGSSVQETAALLLGQNLYAAVGSDAHDLGNRNAVLSGAYDLTREYFGEDRAEHLFWINAEKILDDEDIRRREPI